MQCSCYDDDNNGKTVLGTTVIIIRNTSTHRGEQQYHLVLSRISICLFPIGDLMLANPQSKPSLTDCSRLLSGPKQMQNRSRAAVGRGPSEQRSSPGGGGGGGCIASHRIVSIPRRHHRRSSLPCLCSGGRTLKWTPIQSNPSISRRESVPGSPKYKSTVLDDASIGDNVRGWS